MTGINGQGCQGGEMGMEEVVGEMRGHQIIGLYGSWL